MIQRFSAYVLTLVAYALLAFIAVAYFLRDLFFIYTWGEAQAIWWIAVIVALFACIVLTRWIDSFRWGTLTGATMLCFVLGFRVMNSAANIIENTKNDFSNEVAYLCLILLAGSIALIKRATETTREFTVAMLVIAIGVSASVLHVQSYIDTVVRH